jgi:hypothetical protein
MILRTITLTTALILSTSLYTQNRVDNVSDHIARIAYSCGTSLINGGLSLKYNMLFLASISADRIKNANSFNPHFNSTKQAASQNNVQEKLTFNGLLTRLATYGRSAEKERARTLATNVNRYVHPPKSTIKIKSRRFLDPKLYKHS